MRVESQDLGNDVVLRPLYSKNFREFLQIVCRGFADRENAVSQPCHAQITQFLIKEFNTLLRFGTMSVLGD